ncbi:MAG TPA: type II toxin-antitoxin system prevent-host-death family antitoxin [Solirubrobacterales bacterium]|nr:type II toxin-antitoxin system prevent-host-death family antitoxin [Solirubrobacterales bacterium]
MEISASQFKARCLSLLDEVAESGAELIVTKRGEPVARVGPVDPGASLVGTAEQLVDDEELIAPIGEAWEAEREAG